MHTIEHWTGSTFQLQCTLSLCSWYRSVELKDGQYCPLVKTVWLILSLHRVSCSACCTFVCQVHLTVYDIPSVEHTGKLAGSVSFGESFMDSVILTQSNESEVSFSSEVIVLTSSIPRVTSWMVRYSGTWIWLVDMCVTMCLTYACELAMPHVSTQEGLISACGTSLPEMLGWKRWCKALSVLQPPVHLSRLSASSIDLLVVMFQCKHGHHGWGGQVWTNGPVVVVSLKLHAGIFN